MLCFIDKLLREGLQLPEDMQDLQIERAHHCQTEKVCRDSKGFEGKSSLPCETLRVFQRRHQNI